MAKRRNRQRRKAKKQRSQGPEELLEEARLRLRMGDAREAIDGLKRARRGTEGLEGLDLALFCACSLRARQLAGRGMGQEATASRDQAAALRERVAGVVPDEAEMEDCARCLETADAIRVYVSFMEQTGPSARVDRILADRVIVEGSWAALEALDEHHPLRRDAEVVPRAVAEMDRGAWQGAWSALAGVSRRSPFAPWRLFCKAMVCYAARDDGGVLRALGPMPEEFVLSGVVAELSTACAAQSPGGRLEAAKATPEASRSPAEGGQSARDRVRHCLGLQSSESGRLARDLLEAVQQGRGRDLKRLALALAEAIYPENPEEARAALAEILTFGAMEDSVNARPVMKVVRDLLPRKKALAVAARAEMAAQSHDYGPGDADPAVTYCAHLEVDFPDECSQRLARAQVLEWTARCGHRIGSLARWLHPSELSSLQALSGRTGGDPESVYPDLMRASLEADPGNRDGHILLLSMLRSGDAPSREIEQALENMASCFPEDPEPYLTLAGHHHARNAYRRAEAALGEARKRAPHDDRILDWEAIGYLKSADENRKRSRWHLAEVDLSRAAALARRRVEPILQVKRLAFDLLSAGGAHGPQLMLDLEGHAAAARPVDPEPHLESLTPLMQLRSLALLLTDLDGMGSEAAHTARKWLSDRKGLTAGLSPGEVVELLAPVEEDFSLLFVDVRAAGALREHWPDLVAGLDGDHLLSVFDMLLECDGHGAVSAEIDRRLSGQSKAARDPLLLFYLEVIRHMEGSSSGSRHFERILAAANEPQVQRLRAAASRLARHAEYPLSEALQRLDFEILDLPSLPLETGGGPLPELDELIGDLVGRAVEGDLGWEDEEWDDDDQEENGGIVQQFEDLIDEAGIRGAPMSALRDFAGNLRADPITREAVEAAASECTTFGVEVSRELGVLLFPRRKGTKPGRGQAR